MTVHCHTRCEQGSGLVLPVVTPFMLDVSSEHETIRTPSGNPVRCRRPFQQASGVYRQSIAKTNGTKDGTYFDVKPSRYGR